MDGSMDESVKSVNMNTLLVIHLMNHNVFDDDKLRKQHF